MNIYSFTAEHQVDVLKFLEQQHRVHKRQLDFEGRDKDITDIKSWYLNESEGFWYCTDSHGKIVGTIGLRKMCIQKFTFGEIRRFYVDELYQRQGIGMNLLNRVLVFANQNSYVCLRGTTSINSSAMLHIIEKIGCIRIPQYRESNADVFFEYRM